MARHLNLDRDKLDHCFQLASLIVSQAAKYIDRHSSVSIESATLMAMGVEGEHRGRSMASCLVESLTRDQLRLGVANWWGRALLAVKENPQELAERIIKGKLKWEELPSVIPGEIKKETKRFVGNTLEQWTKTVRATAPFKIEFSKSDPRLGFRFAESKPKRLLSFMKEIPPEAEALSVFQLNSSNPEEELRSILEHLKKEDSILALEGVTLPEQVILALSHGVKALQSDGWYSLFKKEIAPERALTDFCFTLSLGARFGLYFLNRDISFQPPELLASLLLYEQTAKRAGVSLERLIFSFTFPEEGVGLLDQTAMAQMLREIFSQSFLWCRLSSSADPYSIWAAVFAEADVMEWPKPEEWQRAGDWLKKISGVPNEFELNTHGKVSREAHQLLDQTWRFLKKTHQDGVWKTWPGEGPGKEGVFQKSYHYWNPLCQELASS